MAAEVQENLTKVDSAVSEEPASPSEVKKGKEQGHRRTSSTVSGVFNINDLGRCDHVARLHKVICADGAS